MIVKNTVSFKRKNLIGEFHKIHTEIKYDIVREEHEYFLVNRKDDERNNYVIYKDSNCGNEYRLNSVSIDEVSDHRVSISIWTIEGVDYKHLMNEAIVEVTNRLTKKRNRLDEQIKALELI